MDYSNFEFLKKKKTTHRRRLGSKEWKKICSYKDCKSLSKGKSGKCIKHQRNNICNFINCKKRINSNNKFCDKHINNLNNQYEYIKSKNTLSNYLMNYQSIIEYNNNNRIYKNTLYNQLMNKNQIINNTQVINNTKIINNTKVINNNQEINNSQIINNQEINNNSFNILFLTTESELEIFSSWIKYTLNDSKFSNKCQGVCCSFHTERTKPIGKFCNVEGKYLCNLCSVF